MIAPERPSAVEVKHRNRPLDESEVFATFPVEDEAAIEVHALVDVGPALIDSGFECSPAYDTDSFVVTEPPSPAPMIEEPIEIEALGDSADTSVAAFAKLRFRVRRKTYLGLDPL